MAEAGLGGGGWGDRMVAVEEDKKVDGATCEGACLLLCRRVSEVPRLS